MDEEFLEELREETIPLLFRYNYNPNGSDWECVYCGQRQATPGASEVAHDPDCFGVKLLEKLNEVLD